MGITRRRFAQGAAGALGIALAPRLVTPAIAETDPIRIGWLGSVTGPLAAPGVGFQRGMRWAVEQHNADAKARKIEVIERDTQGDPTKAVNATQELISRQNVNAIWGPGNSGESLATTPIMARQTMPNLHPCVVNSLIDTDKYPNAFRLAPSNIQWDDAVRNYTLKILKLTDVAILGDATGYGTSAVKDSVASFKKDGANVVYQEVIDTNQSGVTPNLLHAREAGAKALVIWSVTTGLNARLMSARSAIGWKVPIIGHPALGTGEVGKLVAAPGDWEDVFCVGYRSCSYDPNGKLPPRMQEFMDRIQGKIELSDSVLWWVADAVDAVDLIATAVTETGSTEHKAIIDWLNKQHAYPGLFGDYTFTPQEHNGYPTEEVVMSVANTQRNGAYRLAPGYT
ncbi:MAG: ABC transporter substrate-binding protein [Alphaproteobacteria bacterium]|nr:ABC transporter substrate-binding protein [Alphaproteobacteria bacterium]